MTVPDEEHAIIEALDYLAERTDWIVLSGGLGPTADDITCAVLSTWGNAPLTFHARSWDRIRNFLKAGEWNARIPTESRRNSRPERLFWTTRSGQHPAVFFEERAFGSLCFPGFTSSLRE